MLRMKRNKFCLLLMTSLLLLSICILLTFLASEQPLAVQVFSEQDAQPEYLKSWQSDEEIWYIFLPSYARREQVKICVPDNVAIQIDQIQIYDGMDCSGFDMNTFYEYTQTYMGRTWNRKIVFVQSENIATVHIDTQSGSMEYIHSNQNNEESGALRVYTQTGEKYYEGVIKSLSGRGNSTWDVYEKKPYSIKLKENADLLGMGSAQKWILLANAVDHTHIRNKFVYDFAKEFGLSYSPDSQWVDVYLNGEYAGLYLLCERLEVAPGRVDISQDNSFLVSKEYYSKLISKNVPFIVTEAGQSIRIRYGNETLAQDKLQSVENAILAQDNIDPLTGKKLTDLIDMDSWVKKYLVEEVMGNTDAGHASQYYYFKEDAVYAGPVWDYDNALWNVNYHNFFCNQEAIKAGVDSPWFYALYRNPEFYSQIVEVYDQDMRPLLEIFLISRIPTYIEQVEAAAQLNEIRWDTESGSFYRQTEDLINFIKNRIEFLDEVWVNAREYHIVQIEIDSSTNYAYYVVFNGETIHELPDVADDRFVDWIDLNTGETFDISKPISEDTRLYAQRTGVSSTWQKALGEIVPLGVIFAMGCGLLICEVRRHKEKE